MYVIRKKESGKGSCWKTIKTFPADAEESALETIWDLQANAEQNQEACIYKLIDVNEEEF